MFPNQNRPSFHDAMQVCENGHKITANFNTSPLLRKDFCDKCGAKTIYQCTNCNEPIKGMYHVPGIIFAGGETPIPKHCHKCGGKYPWTDKFESIQKASTKESPDAVLLIENLCNRFHLVVRQLRSRYNNRQTLDIKDEYDVQNLLHALLKIYFDDIRDEEWTPSYAGGCSRVDFLLKKEEIVIEIKKTRKGLKDKKLGEELIIDIHRYKTHPDCKKLICFVYDPDGYISKPSSIEADLTSKKEELDVKTIIVPKGY